MFNNEKVHIIIYEKLFLNVVNIFTVKFHTTSQFKYLFVILIFKIILTLT